MAGVVERTSSYVVLYSKDLEEYEDGDGQTSRSDSCKAFNFMLNY